MQTIAKKGTSDIEKHLDELEKYISFKTAKEAAQSLTDEEKLAFLSNYYLTESLNYDEEINKRTEECLVALDKELEKGMNPPFSPALLESMLNICKLSIMDSLVEIGSEVNKNLREKLKGLKINDFKATMTYQLAMGKIAMSYNKLLAEELQNECKSRGIDFEAFMTQAYPAMVNDFAVFFEIDGYIGLKNYESVKNQPIDLAKAADYSKRTIEYTSMLLEQKIAPQAVTVFPSLMNHFLFLEFGIDSYQVMAKIIELLKAENKKNYMSFFEQILEEIWFVERGRGLIFMMFRQQMEMMEQMMMGGMDPSMMGGMDPGMMGGMDPGMMGGMDPGMMSGFDPAMLGGNLEGAPMPPNMPNLLPPPTGVPPFDPSGMGMPDMEALKAVFENMDVSKLEELMPQMKEMMEFMNNQNKK